MFKRLASITVLSLSLSLAASSATADDCGLVNSATGSCGPPASQPEPGPQPQPEPQPQSQARPEPEAQPQPRPQEPGFVGEAPGAADRLLELVNAERTSRGLPALKMRGDVAAIAGGHSHDMAGRRDLWHNDGYFTKSNRSALKANALGENVGINMSVDGVHQRLMDSPAHRDNILDRRFTSAGFSVVHDERGALYVTENFLGTKAEAKAVAKAAKAKGKGKSKGRGGKGKGGKRR